MTIHKFNLTAFIFFLITGCTTSQQSLTVLNDSWIELKKQLQRRSSIALNLISDTSKLDSSGKSSADMIRKGVAEFNRFIDSTKSLDSTTVQLVKRKALESTKFILEAFSLQIDSSRTSAKDFRDLQSELEAMENRINTARMEFNKLCVQFKRPDLVFE